MSVTTDSIQKLYITFFNRPADPIGLSYWTNLANANGGNTAIVAASFAGTPEYQTIFTGLNPGDSVNAVYLNLFGRPAEAAGLNYWAPLIANGTLTLANIATAIAAGSQGSDLAAITAKLTAANQFTTNIDLAPEILGYSGNAANAVAKAWLAGVIDAPTLAAKLATVDATITAAVAAHDAAAVGTSITLTTGVDALSPTGNATFFATLDSGTATLGGADTISGGGTNNKLVLTDGTAGSHDVLPVGVSISNIQTIVLNTAGNAGAASGSPTFDVSGINGVKSLSVLSAGNGTDYVTAAATTDVSDTSRGAGNIAINGGKTVTAQTTGAGTVTLAGPAGSVNVTAGTGATVVTGAKADITVSSSGAITAGGTSLTANALGGVALATQNADTAAAAAAASASARANAANNAAATVVTDLNSMKTTISSATTQAVNNTATLTALNAGELTLSQKASIDAAFAGGLASSTTAATAQAAAQAAALAVETPIINAAASVAASALAAKNAAAAASTAAAAVVTADTAAGVVVANVVVTDTTNTALTAVTLNNNYTAAGNTIADSSVGQNTLTTVNLNNAGDVTITGLAVAKINESNGTHNITINNATAAHVDTLTLSAVKGSVISDTTAGTFNVVSNGTSTNTFTLTGGTSTTALNITGAAGVTLTADTLAAAAVVDASAAAGKITMTIGAGQTFKGGAGADVITTNGGALQTATVTAGSSTANTLVLANAADFATTGAAKFVGFQAVQLGSGVSADLSKFTASTITAETFNGGVSTLAGLNATAASNVNATASGTYTLSVIGATTVGQLDVVKFANTGAAAITLTAPSLAGIETLNLSTGAGMTITSLANAVALTNVNADGAGPLTLTVDFPLNVNSVFDAHSVAGSVVINAIGSSANGLKIIGSATASNALTGNAFASVLVGGNGGDTITGGALNDIITSGDGNNTIAGGGGVDTVTVGNGNNLINSVGTITAGNGYNVINDISTTGAQTITVGTGYNAITLGTANTDTTATYNVTLGAHTANTGVINVVTIGSAGTAFATAPNLVLTGAVAGDTIVFSNDSLAAGPATVVTAGATLAASLTALETAVSGAHQIGYVVFGGNTYVAESLAGGAASATNTTVIELVGVHTLATASGGIVTIAS